MKRTIIVRVLGIVSVAALSLPLNAQQPTIPPTINSVWPKGLERGAAATFTVEGRNLAGGKVLFDSPGLSGKVLSVAGLPEEKRVARPGVDFGAIVPQGTKQEAKIEVTAAKDAEPGIHWFRVQTAKLDKHRAEMAKPAAQRDPANLMAARDRIKVRQRCKLCGRGRAVYRKFGVCRICLRNLASDGQGGEGSIGLGFRRHGERERETGEARTLLAPIRCHECRSADAESGVHDFVFPTRQDLVRRKRFRAVLVVHEHVHLRAERGAVEFERLFAAAAEEQVGLDERVFHRLHSGLLCGCFCGHVLHR